MESEIVKAAMAQGLWAVLFVILLFYVLRTSGEREKRLIDALDKLSEKFGVLEDVKSGVERIERRLESAGLRQHGGTS